MKRSIVKVQTGAKAMTGKKKAKATGARAGDFVEIRNRDATLRIEKATGFIRGCTWTRTGTDLFQQTRDGIPGYLGGLRVYDEQDHVMYSDLESPPWFATCGNGARRFRSRSGSRGRPSR